MGSRPANYQSNFKHYGKDAELEKKEDRHKIHGWGYENSHDRGGSSKENLCGTVKQKEWKHFEKEGDEGVEKSWSAEKGATAYKLGFPIRLSILLPKLDELLITVPDISEKGVKKRRGERRSVDILQKSRNPDLPQVRVNERKIHRGKKSKVRNAGHLGIKKKPHDQRRERKLGSTQGWGGKSGGGPKLVRKDNKMVNYKEKKPEKQKVVSPYPVAPPGRLSRSGGTKGGQI